MAFVLIVLLTLLVWLLPSMLVAHWADKRGQRGWIWLLVGLIISPLLAALIVLLLGKNEAALANNAV